MGCNSSKDGKQPNTKKIGKKGAQASPQRSPRKRDHSPSNFKAVNEAELQKHKPQDILGFIKTGNVSMVHALINHYKLGQAVILLTGDKDGFSFTKTAEGQVSTTNWNPILLAIRYKQYEVLRYLVETQKIAIRHAGKQPGSEGGKSADEMAGQQVYSVLISIANKDLKIFSYLWDIYTAWDETHLQRVIKELVNEKWHQGLSYLLKSFTTEIIFNSQLPEKQIEIVRAWYGLRSQETPDIKKAFDEVLQSRPYAISTIYVQLSDKSDQLLSRPEKLAHLTKAIQFLDGHPLAQFKFSDESYLFYELQDKIAQFDQLGEKEKALMATLSETITNRLEEVSTVEDYKDQEAFDDSTNALIEAYKSAKLEQIRAAHEQRERKRVPQAQGSNHVVDFEELNRMPYFYWTGLAQMIWQSENNIEEDQIEVFKYILTGGFNIRQALLQTNLKGKNTDDVPRVPPNLGNCLILTLNKLRFNLYEYLWSVEWINVWGPKHFTMITDIISRQQENFEKLQLLLDHHLNSPVGTNLFLDMTVSQRFAFVQKIYNNFGRSYDVQQCLSKRHYAPYLLLLLTERDTFMRTSNFSLYNQALGNTTKLELEIIANASDEHEERFMKFLRYIDMLEQTDQKKVEGKKFISMIFDIAKFQAYNGISLNILDHESRIQDEEQNGADDVQGFDDEDHHDARAGKAIHQSTLAKKNPKDFDLQAFHKHLHSGKQDQIIDHIKQFKFTDLLYFRGSPNLSLKTYLMKLNDLKLVNLKYDQLTLLQVAILNKSHKLVSFILNEYKVMNALREIKAIDQRYLTVSPNGEDNTLTLRLLDQVNEQGLLWNLWSNRANYTPRDLLIMAKYYLRSQNSENFKNLLYSGTSQYLYQEMSAKLRQEFYLVISATQEWDSFPEIDQIYSTYKDLGEDTYYQLSQQIFQAIENDDGQLLKSIIEDNSIRSLNSISLQDYVEDKLVLDIPGDDDIFVRHLNVLLYSVYMKKPKAVKAIVESPCLRALQGYDDLGNDISVTTQTQHHHHFSSMLIPILIASKDTEILNILLKGDHILLSYQDCLSFINWSVRENFLLGLKIFLTSPSVHFYYQTFTHENQRELIHAILKAVLYQTENAELKKTQFHSLVEEQLTKRPYSQMLTLLFMEDPQLNDGKFDLAQVVRNCNKTVSSEDLMQLGQSHTQKMNQFEQRYIQEGNTFEGELSKIIRRYIADSKFVKDLPSQPASSTDIRKQVRFDENDDNQPLRIEAENRV
ncbi:UNKNOWN [Stylonychia lemnae]|uniref:Uncharacterized protein n=1 Tax=Stylonychia lemnae TaxID=5949 RepID=A0A078B1Q1_STYLE|nr:UNKNOWN [Stylonychia lemnae]|eukprot:CDW87252.1 UNKNOWN [Stylonychia lemnae]